MSARPPWFPVSVHTTVLVSALAVVLAGCSDAKGPAHDDHDGHDHGDDDHGDHHDHRGEGGVAHVDEVALAPEAVEGSGIRVEAAVKRVLRPTILAPARAALDEEAQVHVGVLVPGLVREVRVRRGDRVAAGDVLLVLESPEYGRAQIEHLAARDAARRARPAVDLERRLLGRAREAHEVSRSLPLSTVEDRERALLDAEARLAEAESALAASEMRLRVLGMSDEDIAGLVSTGEVRSRIEIPAPIAGVILEREVAPGESVGPERHALAVIDASRDLRVLAEVPETRIAAVAVGSVARVHRTSPGAPPLEGKVVRIEPWVDESTRTVRVRIDLPREGSGLLPGMYAEVELTESGPAPPPVLAVPDGAVLSVRGGPAVFVPVAGEERTFALRPVRTGNPVGGFVPVLEGLSEGEEVVVAGSFLLKAELGKASAAHEH